MTTTATLEKLTVTHKTTSYAYASSETAQKHGHGKTGCWVLESVEVLDRSLPCERKTLLVSTDEGEIVDAFKALELPVYRAESKHA